MEIASECNIAKFYRISRDGPNPQQFSILAKKSGSGIGLADTKFWFYALIAMCPWTNYVSSMQQGFFIYENGNDNQSHRIVVIIKWKYSAGFLINIYI